MSRRERQKGARGERDFRDLVRSFGFDCDRDGRLAADLRHGVQGVHFEVKRCESITAPKWIAQAEAEAGGAVPVVAFRRSREPWRVIAPAADYLEAKAALAALRDVHTFDCGCDRPGDPQVCVATPHDAFRVLTKSLLEPDGDLV